MTKVDPDDAVVEAMARAIDPSPWVLWEMVPGRVAEVDRHLRLLMEQARVDARAALTAYRNVTGDDGK